MKNPERWRDNLQTHRLRANRGRMRLTPRVHPFNDPMARPLRILPLRNRITKRIFIRGIASMSIKLNHTIVHSHDKGESAAFLVEILGLSAPSPFGPFLTVQTDNDVTLDFSDSDRDIAPQHYAFLVSDMEFDEILGRIRQRGIP